MKKSIWALLGVVVIVAVVAGVMVSKKNDTKSSSNSASSSTTAAKTNSSSNSKGKFTEVKACNVLTPAIAHQIAGADATSTNKPEDTTSSVSVTDCSYYSSSTNNSVSLLSRSALDQAGADTNNAQFNSSLPAGAQKVSGYGDAAYWSPTYGQFNILKHNNWYILQAGGLSPSSRTVAQAEDYAKLIVDKL